MKQGVNREVNRFFAPHKGRGDEHSARTALKCAAALLLLAAWLASQTIQFTFIPVYHNMSQAVSFDEGGYIMLAAMWLVLNNSVRVACLYFGWFMLADGLSAVFRSPRAAWALPPVAISASYFGPALLHFPSMPHFGVPALIALTSACAFLYMSRDVKRTWYKLPILASVVFSIQWLDLIPWLTPYGFGWGELSLALKEVAALMERDYLLDSFCSLAFCSSAVLSLLLAKLFVSYEKQLRQLGVLRARERELMRVRTEQARMRLYQEMQYLVHDLRRPLTTILGLADLMAMSSDEAAAHHSRAVLDAAERMDMMIGEIKNPDAVRASTVGEAVCYTMAQVRVLPWGASVAVSVPEDVADAKIMINVIRFSRVLVNLLDNAHNAAAHGSPFIALSTARAGGCVSFVVEDNGPGFAEPEGGAKSSWGSSGLGLAFAREALSAWGGRLSYEARAGGGTVCTVSIPEAGKEPGQWT